MTKSIFDYDSSDDEHNGDDPNITYPGQLSLYRIGNQILNQDLIHTKYINKKNLIIKKERDDHSYVVNNFLKQHSIYIQDLTKVPFAAADEYNNIMQDIVYIHALYQKIKEIYNETESTTPKYKADAKKSKINTKDLQHFVLLSKLINKDVLPEEDKANLANTFSLKKGKEQEFFDQIKKVDGINTIQIQLDALQNTDLKLVSALTTLEKLNDKLIANTIFYYKEKVQHINNAYDIYQKIKEIYNETESTTPKYKADVKKSKINTKDLQHFVLLSKLINKDVLPEEDKANLANTFSLKKGKEQEFFDQIITIQNIKARLEKILEIYKNATFLLKNNIITMIVGREPDGSGLFNQCIDFYAESQLKEFVGKISDYEPQVTIYTKNTLKFFESEDKNASDFLSSSLAYQKVLRIYAKFSPLGFNISAINTPISSIQKTIDINQELYTSTKRTEKVANLGTYKSIQEILVKTELKTTKIVKTIQDIIQGKLYDIQDISSDTLKALVEISYLLFSCEANRNPSALITNAMFLELVKAGKYKLQDMSTKLPMAMSGAIDVGRYYHEQYEQSGNKARKNDYGKSSVQQEAVDQFKKLEKDLLDIFLQQYKKITHIELNKAKEWLQSIGVSISKSEQKAFTNQTIEYYENNITKLSKFKDLTQDKKILAKTAFKNIIEAWIIKNLITSWYGIEVNFIFKAAGEKTEEFFSNDYDYVSPIKVSNENNKYYSVVLKKLVDYKEKTSGVLDFKFIELGQSECIEIDKAIKLKLAEIISRKDPSSKKRSFYEAFPEELCYSGFSVKMLKLEDNKAIKYYYMKHCLGSTESEIINRLLRQGILDREEWEDYTVLNQDRLLQYEPITLFTEEKTRCSDMNSKYKFDIDKQKENNAALLQKKFVAFGLDDNKFDHIHNFDYDNHQLGVVGDISSYGISNIPT